VIVADYATIFVNWPGNPWAHCLVVVPSQNGVVLCKNA